MLAPGEVMDHPNIIKLYETFEDRRLPQTSSPEQMQLNKASEGKTKPNQIPKVKPNKQTMRQSKNKPNLNWPKPTKDKIYDI